MTYKNQLNKSTILTAQLQTDIKMLDEDYKSGLYNYGLEGYIMFKRAENKAWEKVALILEHLNFEREQAGLIAYKQSKE